VDAKHARNSTDHQSLMRPPHHNWPFGYVARCSARLVLTNALVLTGLATFRVVGYTEAIAATVCERPGVRRVKITTDPGSDKWLFRSPKTRVA
jgi:hypothetical protein